MKSPTNNLGFKQQPCFHSADLIDCVAGDRELARGIVELFIESSRSLVDSLPAKSQPESRHELIGLFHRLNGSAASVGARQFSELCHRWELALSRPNAAASQTPLLDEESIDQINQAYRDLLQELDKFLK